MRQGRNTSLRICDNPKVLYLAAEDILRKFYEGTGASRVVGPGVVFEKIREYVVGDDIRRVDWKASARRTQSPDQPRLYVKEFREEMDNFLYLILDCSKSMDFGTSVDLKYSKLLRASFYITYLATRLKDRTIFVIARGDDVRIVEPRLKRIQPDILVEELCGKLPAGSISLSRIVESILDSMRKRSLAFLLTDYTKDPADVLRAAKILRSVGPIPYVIFIKDEREHVFEEGLYGDPLSGEICYLDESLASELSSLVRSHISRMREALSSESIPFSEYTGKFYQLFDVFEFYIGKRRFLGGY